MMKTMSQTYEILATLNVECVPDLMWRRHGLFISIAHSAGFREEDRLHISLLWLD